MTEGAAPVIEAPNDQDAAARSRIYALLGEAFTYPQGAPVIRLLDGDWLADIDAALVASPLPVRAPSDLYIPPSKSAINELQIMYSDLFDVTSGKPRVSLLERRYGSTPDQKLWEELLNFYSHFGLDFAKGYANEQPDHLLTEIAFMHYLSFLEAGTHGDKLSLRRGQRDFLSLHLGVWIAEMDRLLNETKLASTYQSLAELLVSIVECDQRYLAVG